MYSEKSVNQAGWSILLLFLSAITVILPASFPDLALALLFPLLLKSPDNFTLIISFLSGILHDAHNGKTLWLSPIIFPALTHLINYAEENFNLKIVPLRLLFYLLVTIVVITFYSLVFHIPFPYALKKAILTYIFTLIFDFLV